MSGATTEATTGPAAEPPSEPTSESAEPASEPMPKRATAAPPSGPAVIIAGAGPTGLMLAAELALAQVDVALLDIAA